jgi:hypothetical protein
MAVTMQSPAFEINVAAAIVVAFLIAIITMAVFAVFAAFITCGSLYVSVKISTMAAQPPTTASAVEIET